MNNIVTETDIVLLDSRIKKLNHYKNKIKKIGNIVQISAGLQTTSRIELSKPLNYLEFPLFDIPVGFRPTEWLAVYPSGSNNFSMIECTIYNIKMFIEGTIEKNVNIFFSMTYISK